ncbi:hypothetical protein [Rhodopila sp.]|uniref:hypothetical protein n=1 Tax=Rhodopila sp. TaxID=2480087 RepID=UPI003D0F7B1A
MSSIESDHRRSEVNGRQQPAGRSAGAGDIYLGNGSTSFAVEGNTDTVNRSSSGNTVGFTESNDIVHVSNGQIYTNNTTAGSLTIQGSSDSETTVNGTTQSTPILTG